MSDPGSAVILCERGARLLVLARRAQSDLTGLARVATADGRRGERAQRLLPKAKQESLDQWATYRDHVEPCDDCAIREATR